MKRFKSITGFWLGTILFVGASLTASGQQMDYRYVDSATYQLYIHQSWDSLIEIGKTAIRNNTDYYYLRMRMAEAYNAKEQYLLSAQSFEKAREFNQSDPNASAGLYYAYLNSGKKTQAYHLSEQFAESLKQKLSIKPKIVDFTDVFGGYIFSNNAAKNGDIILLDTLTSYGEQALFGDEKYIHAGLMFNLTPSISLYAGGSFIDIAKTTRFQYHLINTGKSPPIDGPGGWINYQYFPIVLEFEETFVSNIKQYELYFNGKLQLDQGWAVNLFTNLLFINTPVIRQVRYAENIRDTLRYNPMNGNIQMITYQDEKIDFIESDSSFVNWLVGFNLQKDFGLINLGLTGTYSELSGAQQGQVGLSCFYYPLGSTKLYGKTELTGFFEFNEYLGDDQRLIFNQLIGVKLFTKTWLEAQYLSGNLNNTNIKQGSGIYNLPEKVNFIAGLNLHIFATDHLEISLIYNYSDKNGLYSNQDINNGEINNYSFNYQTQSVIGGIKWTF
ncbi:MAG: hypothetical protein V2I62_09890 [Bacteroidales bacterium]|jgi:hypothetical protein|nr:hypothetical protein [Bacteroidales bacterium]